MKYLLAVFFVFTVLSSSCAAEESMELTTYYPAPYGTYDEAKASKLAVGSAATMPTVDGIASFAQIDDNAALPGGTKGSIYFSKKDSEFKYHDGAMSSPWKPLGGSDAGIPKLSDICAFKAYLSADQNIGHQYSQIQFDAEKFDYASCFDTATHRFQPNVEGVYHIYTQAFLNTEQLIEQEFILYIRKNGVEVSKSFVASPRVTFSHGSPDPVHLNAVSISDFIYFNGTSDYIEVWCWWNSFNPRDITGMYNPTCHFTYLYGYLVGKP